jgi:O-Antigen ligase
MQTAREALPRPLSLGIPAPFLLGASGALLAAALFLGGGSRTDRLAVIGTAAVGAAGVTVAAALLGRLPVPVLGRSGAVFLALLAGVVAWSALGVWWSIGPDLTWRYANRGLAYAAFCVLGLFVAASVPRATRVVAAGLAVLVAAVVAWALAGKVAPALYPDSFRFARLRDPLEYWNALALMAGTGVLLALWIASSRVHANLVRAAGALLLFASSIALLLTYSRGGVAVAIVAVAVWLLLTDRRLEGVVALIVAGVPALAVSAWAFGRPGLAEDGQPYSVRFDDGIRFGVVLAVVGAAVFALAYVAARYEERRPPTPELAHRVIRWAALGTAGAVALVVLVLFFVADPVDWVGDQARDFTNPTTEPVPQGPARLQDIGSNNRWGWWQEAWEAFTDDPIGGAGAGTFHLVHLKLRDNSQSVTEPHDLPLQALAETGLVGFLLAGGAALAALLVVVGALRRLAGEERAAGLALAVVALLYPLHGLVDYDWDFVAVSAPFFFTLGVLLATATPTRVVRRPFIAFASALVALAAISSLVTPWLADRRVSSSYDALESNRTAAAGDRAEEARSLDPLSVEPLFAEALAKEREGKVLEALRLYVRATQMQPENPETWYQLGAFELGLRSYGWAELHLTRARELDPHGPATQALKDLRAERAGRG